jgi:hypothetical protein
MTKLLMDSNYRGLFMKALAKLLVLVFCLSGCAGVKTVVSYNHISDPQIKNDSYDLACLGFEKNAGEHLRSRVDFCKNFSGLVIYPERTAPNPIKVSLEYVF